MTMLIILSHGFYRRLERQSSGIFENSRIPWSGVQELQSLQEFQRFQSLPFSLRIWTSLVSQRAHQMVLVVSTAMVLECHQSTKAPSRVFQTRVFYRRKASQQIILNIMKRVGKTLRKNLSILEGKTWVSIRERKVKASNRPLSMLNQSEQHFKILKKKKGFRSLSLSHGSVSHGFCKYCSERLH